MGRRIVVMKLTCSLGHFECDGHTVHQLSQRRLTTDLLAPRKKDCKRMHNKVFSDRLPSYFKAARPVLDIQNGQIFSERAPYITMSGKQKDNTQWSHYINTAKI